jgi:hypothetical protein
MSSITTMTEAPGARAARLVEEFVAAASALADLAAAGGFDEIPATAVADLAIALPRSTERCSAAATVATGVVHRSGAVIAERFVSTKRWLVVEGRQSERDAAATIARGRDIAGDLGATGDAWLGGRASTAHVREITTGIARIFRAQPGSVREERVGDVERLLLGVAAAATPPDVRRAADRIRHALDPDGTTDAQLAAYDDQSFRLVAVGSGSVPTGFFDHEATAVIETATAAVIDSWFRTGLRDRGAQGIPASGADSVSIASTDQDQGHHSRAIRRDHLRGLALAHLCRLFLDGGALGTRHDQKPHVVITADLADLRDGLGGRLRVPGRDDDDVLLPTASVQRVLCDADVTTVVTTAALTPPHLALPQEAVDATDAGARRGDEAGTSGTGAVPVGPISAPDLAAWLGQRSSTVLWVGRAARTAPRSLRTALEVRDRHCAFPGCGTDASRCEAHHVQHWEHHGETSIANLVLLCARHHRLVHEGAWTIAATPGGDARSTGCWSFRPPDPARP